MNKSGKNKGGRPTKYHQKYCKKLLDYFEVEPYREVETIYTNKKGEQWSKFEDKANDLPTFEGFASSINIAKDTFYEWIKRHKKFSDSYKRAKVLQMNIWVTNSLKGLYNPAFTIFAGKNMFGWRDKSETDITSGGKPIPILGNALSKNNSNEKVATTH